MEPTPASHPPTTPANLLQSLKTKLTTREGWVGQYDYAALCMPRLPCLPRQSIPIFFGLNDRLPILVAILMGFQHALAMVVGIITVPRILAGGGPSNLNLPPDVQAYLISSALTISGLMSIIQIVRIKLFRGYWIGTGLVSMSGISFTFLPIAQAMFSALRESGFCPSDNQPCPDAYGLWLGTVMVGSLLEIGLSFIPPRLLRKIFPPIVTGTTVFLIGSSLVGVGLSYWAGGAGPCRIFRQVQDLSGESPESLSFFRDCPNITGPGNRHYPWGDARWIGLGLFVFTIIIIVEIFGSPFLRNTQVMIGFLAGITLSASLGYFDADLIRQAPAITFPLVKRFKLGFYAPVLVPVLIGHAVSTVETIGDITATCEVSRLPTDGPEFGSRVQGGLLADGVNSLIAALLTSSPTTTFSQNNGVIAMTRTANRSAGLWASAWLILFGVIGKLGGVFVALPDAALGGITTFLFASVAVSGARILAGLTWDRRDRFILSISLSLGLGVIIVPDAFKFFIPISTTSDTLKLLREGALIVLTTGYTVGAILSVVLNAVIPYEPEALSAEEYIVRKKEQLTDGDDETV